MRTYPELPPILAGKSMKEDRESIPEKEKRNPCTAEISFLGKIYAIYAI